MTTLQVRSWSSQDIRNTAGPAEYLVQRCYATRAAFIDEAFGCHGTEQTVLDRGLASGAEEAYGSLAFTASAGAGISLEVHSGNSGEFSVFDGSAWHGPYPVVGCAPYGMLLRATEANPTIQCKFRATHGTNRVLVQAYPAVSPLQIAALEAWQ